MDSYESTRRYFLQKLGLTVGAVAAGGLQASARIVQKKVQYPLTEEQQAFMKEYDRWMDRFIEVIKERRERPDDLEVNMRLIRLSEQSEAWQPRVNKFMEDENFARHYMIATERMTLEIE